MDDNLLPVYTLFESGLADDPGRFIGEAQGIEAAERAVIDLLDEDEGEVIEIRLGDRTVEEGTLNPDGKVLWTTFGRRKDLR